MEIASDPEEIQKVEAKADKLFKKAGFNEDERENISIALTEVVANAIYHGNKNNLSKKVHIEFVISSENFKIKVRDEGAGFVPDNVANPLKPENLLKDSGRGVFIIKALMDQVLFNFTSTGTEVILVKKRHKKSL